MVNSRTRMSVVSAVVLVAGLLAASVPRPVVAANRASAAQISSPITIDGALDSAWQSQINSAITKVILGTVSSTSDLAGNYGVLWDSTNFYLLVDVTDDSPRNDSTTIAEDDSIDIYFDMNYDRGTTYGPDDFMFQFSSGDATFREVKHSATTGVQFASAARAGGYRLEVKIPWSTLGVTPSANQLFGLDVMINDDDDGGSRDTQMSWNSYDATAYLYPDRFGDCQLVGGVAPVTATPAPGSINAGTTIALATATSGATIYYTTDGSDPRTSTTRKIYSSPIIANTLTVKAYATAPGMAESAVSSLAYTLNTSSYVNIVAHGATANDGSDDTAAIRAAITAAKTAGKSVFVPAGTFHHNDHLILDAVTLVGTGSASILHAPNDLKQNLRVQGSGVRVSDLKLTSPSTTRGNTGEHVRLFINGATNFIIERVTVDGAHGAGMMIRGSSQGVIRDNHVEDTMADGIHNTGGSSYITIEYNTVTGVGDDMIAVVSYGTQSQTNNVTIRRNNVWSNTWGRGITVVGGNTVTIEDNIISRPYVGGIYIASEASYNTAGVSGVMVRRNTIEYSAVGNPNSGHGALMVYSNTSNPVTDIIFADNQVYDSQRMGIHVRGGSIATIEFRNNLIQRTGNYGFLVANSFKGSLVATGNTAEETASYGFLHETPDAAARITLDGNTFRNINRSRGTGVDVIHLQSGSLTALTIKNNLHTNLAGYPLGYFIEENVSATTQTIGGNSSPLNSRIDGVVAQTP